LFEWPVNEKGEQRIDEDLILSSGKMQLLDRLESSFPWHNLTFFPSLFQKTKKKKDFCQDSSERDTKFWFSPNLQRPWTFWRIT
jgi:hypothetical protein